MKRYRITAKGRSFNVKVLDDPLQDQVRVEVDGTPFTVGVEAVPGVEEPAEGEAGPVVVPGSVSADGAPSANVVTAPLPGVIKSVTVRAGQWVAPNDRLVVIEAMKMDNVIRAPRRGSIGTILVSQGQRVAYGDPLLEYQE